MAAAIEAGQLLGGKYKILRTLGEGGMGVVLAAEDIRLERTVAIKLLRTELASHQEAAERFVREARAAVKIQSEHVARVLDVDLTPDQTPMMVMEYLEGQDLEHAINERPPLAVQDVALWVIQACDAIAEAHAQRIVHRDLKPANIFLARQPGGGESVKVLDFGISKRATVGGDLSLTRTSALMGSPLYMSPEQMRSTRDVDTRTDIWALGAILHEALCGRPPFEGETITQLSANVLLEEPTRLDALRPDLPEGLADVVWRALRKNPAERFAHVGELALALLPFAQRGAATNIERIRRVLLGAGIVQASFATSDAPAPGAAASLRSTGHGTTVPPSPPLRASLAAKARTLANFVQTGESQPPKKPAPLWRAFAALGVLAALAALLLGRPPLTERAAASSAAAPLAAPALEAVPVQPIASQAAPPPAPPAAVLLESEPAAPLTPGAASAVPSAVPAAIGVAAAGAAKRPAASGTRRAAPVASSSVSTSKTAVSTTTTRRETTTESSTYSGTFKSKFGSRK
jgi:eukaryotic-like serine/threonine-protein kinase